MNLQYNYPEILAWLEQKGKQDYGDTFCFEEQDTPKIIKLIAYFLKDEVKTKELGIDLTKGILLTGPVGCGKTSLMTLMKYVTKQNNRFYMKTCRDISFEFIKEEFKTGSLEKLIPAWVFSSNKEFIYGILSGYFNGDGNVSDILGKEIKQINNKEQ